MPFSSAVNFAKNIYGFTQTPAIAKLVSLKDTVPLTAKDPGPERSSEAAIKWLEVAQDKSISRDGGVARHYSYITGWGASYPETTGYIVPTIIRAAKEQNDHKLLKRGKRMLDWLVSIQLPNGGFQAGTINAKKVVPCTFNSGQILLGLAEGVRTFGDRYRGPMNKAAHWLATTQDKDGCWRKYPTPFAQTGEKTYETHVAWGLFEAAEIESNDLYFESAVANIKWALQYQTKSGWFEKCCLTYPRAPLTHTLGYVMRGILEAYIHSSEPDFLEAAVKLGDGLLEPLQKNGFLPGRLSENWSPAASWSCLTGSVQIAYCWLALYEITGAQKYLSAALAANKFVRTTQYMKGPLQTMGAVKGSFPVHGEYGKYEFLNWAAKFLIDSNSKEMEVMKQEAIKK